MVTETTSSQSEETTSAPAVDTSVVPSGDEPLIPANFVEGLGVVEPGASTVEASGAGTEEENGAVEQTETTTGETGSETTEATETAAEVTETVTEESTETEAAEEETPAERTFSLEEVGKIESAKDTIIQQRDTQIEGFNTRIGDLERQLSTDSLNVAVQGYTNAINQQLVDQGMDQNLAANVSGELAATKRQAFELTQENERLKGQVTTAQTGQQQTAAQALATGYAREHGVPADKMGLLAMATSDESMQELAKELGGAAKLRQEQIKAKQAEVPSGGEANQFDKGAGGSTTQSGEDWLLNVYNPGFADTPADHERARKVAVELGWG